MSWKTNEDGQIELKDGNPVYIKANGEESVVHSDTIGKLNKEAQSHREAKQALETKLSGYGDLDPVEAKEALELVSKMNAKELVDGGKVEELKSQMKSQYDEKLNEKDTLIADLNGKYDSLLINQAFKNSEYIRNNIAVPADMFQATFKDRVKVEDGRVVVLDEKGNRLGSKERMGEDATVEEGFRIFAESHPNKDVILKANVPSGSGSTSNGSTGNRGPMYVSRAELSKLSPVERAKQYALVRQGKKKLTD